MSDLPSSTFHLPTAPPSTEWEAHLLQSRTWGELKSRFGWLAVRVQADDTVVQILFRRLPLGFTLAYVPKGPNINWANNEQCAALFAAIHAEAKKRRAILLKVEPDIWHVDCPPESHVSIEKPKQALAADLPEPAINFLTKTGFIPADTIQPRTSLVIDLSSDEDVILAAMKQKTRYNIRLAEKKGVTVRLGQAADVAIFHQIARITAARDGFGVHSFDYYQVAYSLFAPDHCALLVAEFEGRPLAALMAFSQGREAYYFYGASANEQRQVMAPYLLQWAAIRWAKNQGCTHYDLWGIPDADPATLEAEFEQRHDGLWGVYRFKRGFGGQWVQSIGAFDYVYNPLLYRLYKLARNR